MEELYFKTDKSWRQWLSKNYDNVSGVYLIFYKIENAEPSMRWEEAVKVALCFGWIDSTVKSLGNGKRRQYFTKRNPKSAWSALNKRYVQELLQSNLLHKSGLASIEIAKSNGSWYALDNVENEIIPKALMKAFNANKQAYTNYLNFAPSYRKSYLYWLNSAKREETQKKRILEIIRLCASNQKNRGNW